MTDILDISLNIEELHRVIYALQKEGSEECRDVADRLLYVTEFTRKQLVEVYGCDAKRVKALTNPNWEKQRGDGSTHYFRLWHPVVLSLMQEIQDPAANWIAAQYVESEARCKAQNEAEFGLESVEGAYQVAMLNCQP